MINISIGNKSYKVKEAKLESELRLGLKGVKSLPKDEGMLFYFDPPREVSMTMQDTLIALDLIFINDDQEVIKVVTRESKDENLITVLNVSYVLELNANSGVKKEDELEFEDSDSDPIMKVLFPDGSELMQLWGGERIFRRAFTKLIILWAKKADSVKYDEKEFNKICIRLGKKMFKEIEALDNRSAEYVEVPK